MPIYEYRCERCGDFEEMQRITDPPLEHCPKCRRKVRRLISNTSFQLKGSGWYVTDYPRGGGDGRKKDITSDTGSGDGKTDSKSESKPEAKSETKSDTKATKSESKSGSGGGEKAAS
jgi:putative FmdB family regulatory protein